MFNIGPLELMVLAVVGLIVLGPERLPGFIRDAGRLLRSLRDMATGARQQLQDELGPEFTDIDLRNLNPRTAITKAVFGDEPPDLRKYDPRSFDAKSRARDLIYGEDDKPAAGSPASSSGSGSVSMSKATPPSGAASPAAQPADRPRPRPRPTAPPAASSYDDVL